MTSDQTGAVSWPLTRVIELRTHGVSGTPPEAMLNASTVVQVGGDAKGRFFQAADELGRPVFQVNDLEAGDGHHARYREGYHWGRMTSGGAKQALWAVLFPFAMVNLAQWMVPPTRTAPGRAAVFAVRALVRTIGLFLTALIMVQLTVIAADLIGAQCLGPGSSCLKSGVADYFRVHPLLRALAVAVVIVMPVVVIGWITANAASGLTDPDTTEPRRANTMWAGFEDPNEWGPQPNIAADDFYAETTSAPARTLHWIAALSAATLVLSGGLHRPEDGVGRWTWLVAVGLFGLAGLVNFLLDDPRGTGGRFAFGGRFVVDRFGRGSGWRYLWLVLCPANLVVAAIFPYLRQLNDRDRLTQTDAYVSLAGVNDLTVAAVMVMCGLCALCGIAAVIAACLARRDFTRLAALPGPFKIWLFGIHGAVVVALAALVGAGLGVGATQTVRTCITTGCAPVLLKGSNPDGPAMPEIYDAIALLWGFIGAAAIVGVVVLGIAVLVARWRPNPVAEALQATGSDGGPVRARGFDRIPSGQGSGRADPARSSWFVARINQQTARIVAALVAWSVLSGVVAALATNSWVSRKIRCPWLIDFFTRSDGKLESWAAFLQGVGVFLLAALLAGLLWSIYKASRQPDSAGRSLGVLWDLTSFWPAEGHPIVPPCYARAAVRDLENRAVALLEANTNSRLVLCGHSQGSLLMYATALRLFRRTDLIDRVGLVTFGSQLQWAYSRGFPDMLSYVSHEYVMAGLRGRWQNLIRFTDLVGGPVLSWDRRRAAADGAVTATALTYETQAAAHPADARRVDGLTAPGVLHLGNEHWLADPVIVEPYLPERKHADYTLDRSWDGVVARAAGLTPAAARAPAISPERL